MINKTKIRCIIRNIISESILYDKYNLNENIIRLLNKIKDINYYFKVYKENINRIRVTLHFKNTDDKEFTKEQAYVLLKRVGGPERDHECGENFSNTYEIHSENYTNIGIGPLLYDIGLEVSTIIGNGLKTGGASPDAQKVWQKYYDLRSDVEKKQYDMLKDTLKILKKKRKFSGVKTDYLLTDESNDDCDIDDELYSLIDTENKFIKSPLTKIYFKHNNNLLRFLSDEHRIIFVGISNSELKIQTHPQQYDFDFLSSPKENIINIIESLPENIKDKIRLKINYRFPTPEEKNKLATNLSIFQPTLKDKNIKSILNKELYEDFLSDYKWSNLYNIDQKTKNSSYNINSLQDIDLYDNEIKKYIDDIFNHREIEYPVIVRGGNKFFLISDDKILKVFKALNINPKILVLLKSSFRKRTLD